MCVTQVPASDCVMLASVVSSAFLGRMAAKEGFKFEQTLTGFKWLGNKAIELQAQGKQVRARTEIHTQNTQKARRARRHTYTYS